jgi:hypothetical protein
MNVSVERSIYVISIDFAEFRRSFITQGIFRWYASLPICSISKNLIIRENILLGSDLEGNEDQQREKLRLIAHIIDKNHDEQISRDEMRSYVEQRIKYIFISVLECVSYLLNSYVESNILVKLMN